MKLILSFLALSCGLSFGALTFGSETALKCSPGEVYGLKAFEVSGTLVKKGGVHQKYLAIVETNSKTWELVDLTDEERESLVSLLKQSVKAKVVCSGQGVFDEVQIKEISPAQI